MPDNADLKYAPPRPGVNPTNYRSNENETVPTVWQELCSEALGTWPVGTEGSAGQIIFQKLTYLTNAVRVL